MLVDRCVGQVRIIVVQIVEIVLLRGEAHEAVVEPVDTQRARRDKQYVDSKVELVAAETERALEVALRDVHLGELDARRDSLVKP